MSAAGDLYAKIAARYAADTGSGGLANTSSSAYLRGGMYRQGDKNNRSLNWPRVEVQVTERTRPKFGTGSTDGLSMVVYFRIVTDELTNFTELDPIVQRLFNVTTGFHRWTPAASSDWSWTQLVMASNGPQGVVKEKERITMVAFSTIARRQ